MKYIQPEDLERWADSQEAEGDLPILIRKLLTNILTLKDVGDWNMPGGSSTWKGGFDGRLLLKVDALGFKKDNIYVIEMGKNKNPHEKFKDDCANLPKKLLNTQNINTFNFVFITPRCIGNNRDSWIKDIKSEVPIFSRLGSIQIFDADDIVLWLEKDWATTLWFAEKIGKPSVEIESADSFWSRWIKSTSIPLNENIVLSRKRDLSNDLDNFAKGINPTFILKGSFPEEPILYFISWAKKQPNADELLSKTIICKDKYIWEKLTSCSNPLQKYILIPFFEEIPDNLANIEETFQVILPLKPKDSLTDQHKVFDIPDINKNEITEFFSAANKSRLEARNILELADYNLYNLQQLLARKNAPVPKPKWSQNTSLSSTLIKLSLLGEFDSLNQEDIKVVEKLLGKQWIAIEKEITYICGLEHSPIEQISTVVKISSPYLVLNYLRESIPLTDIKNFLEIIKENLSAIDPRYSLPAEKRWFSSLLVEKKQISNKLKNEMCKSLALLGAMDEEKLLNSSFNLQQLINETVSTIFTSPTKDNEWMLWASLGNNLPSIAEAAPDTFIEILEKILAKGTGTIRSIFNESKGSGLHTEYLQAPILWALETLAWNKIYLPKVCDILMQLHALDKGTVNKGNSPLNTLTNIFKPWLPQNNVSFPEMRTILDSSLKRIPEDNIKFDFLIEVCSIESGGPTASPLYRKWEVNDYRTVSHKDSCEMLDFIYEKIFELIGTDGAKLSKVIQIGLHAHYREIVDKVVVHVNKLDFSKFTDDGLIKVKDVLASYFYYAELNEDKFSKSKYLTQILNTLKNISENKIKFSESYYNYVYLYSRNNAWNIKSEEDSRLKYVLALQEILSKEGIEGLVKFINHPYITSGSPIYADVGNMEMKQEEIKEIIAKCLQLNTPHGNNFVESLTIFLYHKRGISFLDGLDIDNWNITWKTHIVSGYPLSEELIEWTKAKNLLDIYLSKCNPYIRNLDKNGVEKFLSILTDHKEYIKAAELIECNSNVDISSDIILSILSNINGNDAPINDMLHYRIKKLFEKLYKDTSINEQKLLPVEFKWFDLLVDIGNPNRTQIPKGIKKTLYGDPKFIADIVSIIYGQDSKNESQKTLVSNLYHVLRKLISAPKTEKDFLEGIETWVYSIQSFAENDDSLNTKTNRILGHFLANTPPDPSDNIFPYKSIRNVIEKIKSNDFEEGFEVGIFNKRGIHSVPHINAGDPERAIAKKYYDNAQKLSLTYPRTSTILRKIGDSYLKEGTMEDAQEKLRGW